MRSARGTSSGPARSGIPSRQRELELLRAAWVSGAPLLTAWGPGGSGKSWLIRRFVDELASTPKTTPLIVDLSDATDARDLRRRAGEVLDTGNRNKRSTASRHAAQAGVVLLLDDFDRMACASVELIREWLEAQPPPRILISSREALWLPDEERVEVGPLPPDDACELLTRAAHLAGGAPIDEPRQEASLRAIVSGLDALPLALQIAAAQLSVLTPRQLEARLPSQLDMASLDAARPEHETLRAVVEQSWRALSASEQAALMRLSVCNTSMAVENAEHLLQLDSRVRPLQLIESLRRHAMLTVADRPFGGKRLRLYTAVRLYARELIGSDNACEQAHDAFAQAVLGCVERTAAEVRCRVDPDAMTRLRDEEENGRAVYDWYRTRNPEKAGRVALALQELYRANGPFPAQIDLLTEALGNLPPNGSPSLGAQLLVARAELLRLCGHVAEAEADLAVVVDAPDTDVHARVDALRLLGTVQRMRGNLDVALETRRAALGMARAARLRSQEARCLGELGTILAALGQLQEAARHHRAALDLHRREGDLAAEGIELSNLGVAIHRLGHMQQAREIHEQAVAIHRRVGNRRSEAGDLCHLAFVLHQTGEFAEADSRFAEALRVCSELGDLQLSAVVKTWWGDLLSEMDRPEQSTALLQEALGFHEASDDARLQAIAHLGLSHACQRAGRTAQAIDELRSAIHVAPAAQSTVRALSHAYLAKLLEASGIAEAAAGHRREALALVEVVPGPLDRTAVMLLVGQDLEGKLPMPIEQAASLSSEVRRALAPRAEAPRDSRTLLVGAGGQWLSLGTTRLELGRRKSLRLIMAALVEARLQHPGEGLPWHKLVEAGWPGEKMSVDAAQKRVYTAIWTLRKTLLDPVLATTQDGYLIDPAVQVVVDPAAHFGAPERDPGRQPIAADTNPQRGTAASRS